MSWYEKLLVVWYNSYKVIRIGCRVDNLGVVKPFSC